MKLKTVVFLGAFFAFLGITVLIASAETFTEGTGFKILGLGEVAAR